MGDDGRILELGIFKRRKTDVETSIPQITRTIDRFLVLITEIATEGETLRTSEFRTRIDEHRVALARTADIDGLVKTLETCLNLCQDYFKRGQEYLLEREAELTEVIDVLRKAVAEISGNSKALDGDLTSSYGRFKRLVGVQDIRELKQLLLQEIVDLERVVTEKQKREESILAQAASRIEILQAKLSEARHEASLDPLLRIANRGYFDRTINSWVKVGERRPLVLAMLDVDGFKAINDTHGHQIGDQVLLCICTWLNKSIRSNDFLARYGGDEFAILISEIAPVEAEARFWHILKQISSNLFEYKRGGAVSGVSLAVSCGVAEYVPGDSAEDLVRHADQALLEAKKRGKNCVVLSRRTTAPPPARQAL